MFLLALQIEFIEVKNSTMYRQAEALGVSADTKK